MDIEYREIVGFPDYRVGNDGSVWTRKAKGGNDRAPGKVRNRWLRLATHCNADGYVGVSLDCCGKTVVRRVHRLVLEAFIGPRPRGKQACHYPDPNPANNALSNLRWDTQAENAKDKYRDRPTSTVKLCRRCRVEKSISEFYSDKRASDGLQTECKKCHCATAYRTADKERRRSNNRAWMRKYREK